MADIRSELEEYVDGLDTSTAVALWNEYCYASDRYDDEIIDMEMFDEHCSGMSPMDIAQRIWFGDFNPNRDYWCYNGYANFVSFNFIDDDNSPYYASEMIDHIIDDDDDLGDADIRAILDGEDEEEYEEEYEDEQEEEL